MHETWWNTYGKTIAYLVLGILAVLGAMFGALVLLGVIF